MNNLLNGILPLALAIGTTGCVALNAPHQTETVQIQPANTLMGDGMLDALQAGNYPDFIESFSLELKESVSEAAFRKLCMDLKSRNESLANWKRLDTLDRGGLYHTEVWKIVLLKSGKTGKSRIERLLYVTTAKLDGKTAVIGFKFDPLF